jgi:hypothetical protein
MRSEGASRLISDASRWFKLLRRTCFDQDLHVTPLRSRLKYIIIHMVIVYRFEFVPHHLFFNLLKNGGQMPHTKKIPKNGSDPRLVCFSGCE